jgi:hypothetical protein
MRIILVFGVLILGLGLGVAVVSGAQTVRSIPQDFFAKPNGMGSGCTRTSPCSLPTALTLATTGDNIYAGEGNYTGNGAVVVSLGISIHLLGGWDGSAIGPITRDPDHYFSVINGEHKRRVMEILGNATPTIDGFTITGGNATGLKTHCQSDADGCGGGFFIYNAYPIISNNLITDNVAAISTAGYPTGTTGYGGGIYMVNAPGAVISDNLIISNTGSLAFCGAGGGIFIDYSNSGLQVKSNKVLSNTATTTNYGCAWGGGIYGGPSGVLIQGNTISGNRANGYGGGSGAGIYQWYGSATYLNNLIKENLGNVSGEAVYLGYSQARFEGNLVIDNATNAGLRLINGSGNGPTLVNNVVVHDGNDAFAPIGDVSVPLTAKLIHNTLIGSGSGNGILVDSGYVTLKMTNTIITNFAWGITNTFPSSSTLTNDHTQFWANTHDGLRGSNPVDGNPLFAEDGYHLGLGSAAINAGVDAGITTDMDGDLRPLGPRFDIGADEADYRNVFLPVILRN